MKDACRQLLDDYPALGNEKSRPAHQVTLLDVAINLDARIMEVMNFDHIGHALAFFNIRKAAWEGANLQGSISTASYSNPISASP